MTLPAEVGARLSYAMDAATRGPWAVSEVPPAGASAQGGVYLTPAGDRNTFIAACASPDVGRFIVQVLDAAAIVIAEHLARRPVVAEGATAAAPVRPPISAPTLRLARDTSPWRLIEQYDPSDLSWDPAEDGFSCQVVTPEGAVVADELDHADARLVVLAKAYAPELLDMYGSLVEGRPAPFEESWNLGPKVPGRWW